MGGGWRGLVGPFSYIDFFRPGVHHCHLVAKYTVSENREKELREGNNDNNDKEAEYGRLHDRVD